MPTVYITAPPEAADNIARALVERRLAACVNQVPCTSTYRWEGEIVVDEEVVLLAKTSETQYPALVDYVASAHPYDVPCIERFSEVDLHAPFAEWRDAAVSPESH